ncbi:MAG: mechanosensitive ion channel family protein [Allosphingosinicella sp.]|uniref:mechanosensitive ion channel family protein n=1 Tax=Allosphingosinicella sp. TaxID=2823234 RepID=UPI003921B5E7
MAQGEGARPCRRGAGGGEEPALIRFAPLLLLIAAILAAAVPARAQAPALGNAAAPAEAPVVQDPFGRTTPAGAMAGYIQAIADRDYERAARYLDLSGMSAARRARLGPDLARQFQAVLDREGELLPRTEISRAPEGSLEDQLDPDLERVGRVGRGEDRIDLLLRRIENEDGSRYWAVSRQTLNAALALDVGAPDVAAEAWLPDEFTTWQVAGAPLSHWLTLVAIVLVTFGGSWLVLRLIQIPLRRGTRLQETRRFVGATAVPLILFAAVGLASWLAPALGISIVAREAFSWVTLTVGWIAFGWLLWRLLDLLSNRLLAGLSRRGRASGVAIVRVANRIAKVTIIAITFIAIFDVFGFDVTAALAALGIGGIALALGAQKTIENLIASLSIVSDRPFKVGDVCRFGARTGTVEDVGMRSSRVRTLDRTLLTIPNSSLVNAEIENLSMRDRFLFQPVLSIAGDTDPGTVRRLLERLRAAFHGDETLFGHAMRVRLLAPIEDRLQIELFGYVLTADFDEWLERQEAMVLRILDILAEEKVRLVAPLAGLRN